MMLDQFLNVRRHKKDGREAPHKLFLLLACIDWIEKNQPSENKILLDEKLFDLFHKYWNQLDDPERSNSERRSSNPVYYLKNDDLGWKVYRDNNERLNGPISESTLMKEGAFAQFSEDTWQYLQSAENRELVRFSILAEYFPEEKRKIPSSDFKMLKRYDEEIFKGRKAQKTTKNVEKTEYERNPLFRYHLLDEYDYTCAISGLRIIPAKNIIQACHIIPFAETGDNSLGNGIVLCANLHSAFDSGLIGIGNDYEVLINHRAFRENQSSYNLSQFEGREIKRPKNQEFWPSLDLLMKHRKRHFK